MHPFRFSLRTLIIVVFLVAIPVGFLAEENRKGRIESHFINLVREVGPNARFPNGYLKIEYYFDYEIPPWDEIGFTTKAASRSGTSGFPPWLSYFSGESNFERLIRIESNGTLPDDVVSSIGMLPDLQQLIVCNETKLRHCLFIKNLDSLRWLAFQACTLESLDGIESSTELQVLVLRSCRRLKNFEALGKCSKIKTLCLMGNSPLQNLDHCPEILGELSNLETLYVSNCRWTNVAPLANCKKLKNVYLIDATELADLSGISKLPELENLTLRRLGKLDEFPICNLPELTHLELVGSFPGLTSFNAFHQSTKLESLIFQDGTNLESLAGFRNFVNLTKLEISNQSGCLVDTSELQFLLALKSLWLEDINCPSQLSELRRLKNIEEITIQSAGQISDFDSFRSLSKLNKLSLTSQPLTKVGALAENATLKTLDLSYCKSLSDLDGLTGVAQLELVCLQGCDALESIEALFDATNLQSINLRNCASLRTLNGLENCNNLSEVDLSRCAKLENVDGLRNCKRISEIEFSSCVCLKNVDGLQNCIQLRVVSFHQCHSLDSTSGLLGCHNVRLITLNDCGALKNITGPQGMAKLDYIAVHSCDQFSTMELSDTTSLREISLYNCKSITDLDWLHGISRLDELSVYDCERVSDKEIEELKETFPSIDIDHF